MRLKNLNCPLCTEPTPKGECSDCGIFWCRHCERWRGWGNGCADNMPEACDKCWMPIEKQFEEGDLVWWVNPHDSEDKGVYVVVSTYRHHVNLTDEAGSRVETVFPEELVPIKSIVQKDRLITERDLKRIKYDIRVDKTGLAPGHELILECGPPSPIPLPKDPLFPYGEERVCTCSYEESEEMTWHAPLCPCYKPLRCPATDEGICLICHYDIDSCVCEDS